jgi:hypothetical protein
MLNFEWETPWEAATWKTKEGMNEDELGGACCKVHGTGSMSCPVAAFGVSSVET